MFFVLVSVIFVIKMYVLNNFFPQYKYIRATTGVPWQPCIIVLYILWFLKIYNKLHTYIFTLFNSVDIVIIRNAISFRSVQTGKN